VVPHLAISEPTDAAPDLNGFQQQMTALVSTNIDRIQHQDIESGDLDLYFNEIDPVLWGMIGSAQAVGVTNLSTKLFYAAQDMSEFYCHYIMDPRAPDSAYYAWGVSANPATGTGLNDTETLATAAVLSQVAVLALKDARFSGDWAYLGNYLVQFLQANIFQRYYNALYGGKIPWTAGAAWSDDASYFGILATALYQATGITQYRDIAVQIGNLFIAKLQTNGQTGLMWDDGHPKTEQGGRALRMLDAMYKAGLVLTRNGQAENIKNDLIGISNDLVEVIWNGSTSNPLFSNAIGTRPDAGSNGVIAQGWGLAGQYSYAAQQLLLGTVGVTTGANGDYASQINLLGDLMLSAINPPLAPPAPFVVASLVNAASFAAGVPVAPATYATIKGTNLNGKDFSVSFNGIPATVIYPTDVYPPNGTQINLLVPPNLPVGSPVQMVVTIDGKSVTSTVTLASVSPAVFVPGILNQDNQVNSNPYGASGLTVVPAPCGTIVSAYMTGLFPSGIKGDAVVTAKIGGQNVSVLYADAYPGNIGLDQVNVAVPVDTPAGKTQISVCVSLSPSSQVTCSSPVDFYVGAPQP
jgi:uncharacterized protein (TIGR03437 family)